MQRKYRLPVHCLNNRSFPLLPVCLRPRRGGRITKMIAGVCRSVCRVPQPNSRTERPRKLKIRRMEADHTSNLQTYLEVIRSRSPGRLMLTQ